MKYRLILVIMASLMLCFTAYSESGDADNSDFGTDRGMFQSNLRQYRQQHYRDLPAWWHKYTHEQANFLWVSYSKNKKLLYSTYRNVMNNGKNGAAYYNRGLALYRQGARQVHAGNMWRRSIDTGLLARRMFYLALRMNNAYHHSIPGQREFIIEEFRLDSIANQKDMAAQRDAARRRLMGGQQERRDYNIELDNNVSEIR